MILFGTNRMNGAFVGASAVSKIYVGTDLVYQKSSGGSPVLFDDGWIDGIEWSGNLLTRPNYTSQGHYSFDAVETNGKMDISIYSGGSYSHNAHVCTTNKIDIPSNATKLKVRVNRGPNTAKMKFGLLSDAYTNSCSDDGGVMSSAISVTTTEADYELTLPSGFAGSSNYRVVINIQDTASQLRRIYISKVWFE